MNLKFVFAAGLLALSLTACGQSQPQPAAAPEPAPMKHEGMDHSQMKGDCDMQGMDMSKMSAADHQAMMEKCQPADTKGDGHAEHPHGGQP